MGSAHRYRLVQEESGQTVVVSAAFLCLVAIGFIAFAVDVGYLFQQKRLAQSAADACALAAAAELASGYPGNEQSVANGISAQNGFDTTLATNPATVVLSTPSSGNFIGSSYVQATVSRPIPTFFLGAFSPQFATVPVSASATAGGTFSSPTCVCLEGTSGQVLSLSNNSQLNAAGCGIMDNSGSSNAVGIVGGSTLSGLSLGTVSSNWNNGSNINNGGSISSSTKIVQGLATGCSPAMPAAPVYAGCQADPGGSYGTFTWGPSSPGGVVCYNGLTIGANGATVTLNPGSYVINSGQLHFESGANNHSNLGGNGVFFYLTGSSTLVIDNGANVNLVAGGSPEANGTTAPTVGNYNGLVFFQASTDTQPVSMQGGSSTYIYGSFYAPGAAITIGNGSGASLSGGIVAQSLAMTGGGTLHALATTNEGSLTAGSARVVE